MMQQYLDIKNQYKDFILFYRLGDFYEMFFDDAIKASRELELTLTGRDCGEPERAPMCGVPYHSAEVYIGKLISKGYDKSTVDRVISSLIQSGEVDFLAAREKLLVAKLPEDATEEDKNKLLYKYGYTTY